MNFTFAPVTHKYSEISQTIDLKFSAANEENGTVRELFSPFKCRDFFNEILYANQKKVSASIYGFTFDGARERWPDDKLRMFLTFPDSPSKERFLRNSFLITDIENKNSLKVNNVFETSSKTKLYMVADPIWRKTGYMLSLYTLLCRIACYDVGRTTWQNDILLRTGIDNEYWSFIRKKATIFLSDIQKYFTDEFGMFGTGENHIRIVHDYSGIVSVMSTSPTNYNKYSEHFTKILR